jgi:hypothetical protein
MQSIAEVVPGQVSIGETWPERIRRVDGEILDLRRSQLSINGESPNRFIPAGVRDIFSAIVPQFTTKMLEFPRQRFTFL